LLKKEIIEGANADCSNPAVDAIRLIFEKKTQREKGENFCLAALGSLWVGNKLLIGEAGPSSPILGNHLGLVHTELKSRGAIGRGKTKTLNVGGKSFLQEHNLLNR